MFKDAKVGDKVFDYTLQEWGQINAISTKNITRPIKVLFDIYGTEGYTIDGRNLLGSVAPVLFWNEVKPITPPEKPLPTLKVDDKVLVWDNNPTRKLKRYFSHFDSNGKIHCFLDGSTSWSRNESTALWDNWELAND